VAIYYRPRYQLAVNKPVLLEACQPRRKPFYSNVSVYFVKFFTNAVRHENEHWIKDSGHFEAKMLCSLTGYFR